MKVKFNKFERVAGIFVIFAIVGALAITLAMAIKKGWLTSKVPYQTQLSTADGIHPGTTVQISGLRAGSVSDVDLVGVKKVIVKFQIMEKFRSKIRADSRVQIVRPFIIGEKVLELTVGATNQKSLARNSHIPAENSYDVMDLVSGKKLAPFLGVIESLADNMKMLAQAFSDPKRSKSLIEIFDQMGPMMENMNTMAVGVAKTTGALNKKGRINSITISLTHAAKALSKMLPELNKEVPDLGRQMGQIVKNMNILTAEFQKLTPAIAAIAPEMPRASRRAIEALDETVIVLKALQKSWMLKSSVKEIREREAKERQRVPAADEEVDD